MSYADLHLHSTASDGALTPREIVQAARRKGFRCIAIADHDTVGGVAEALRAGEELGVEVLPAVELSTLHRGGEVHILGYCIDWEDQALLEKLETVAGARLSRARQMVARLQELGIDISWPEVREKAGGGAVGRPHIARVLVEKGYIGSMKEAFTGEFIGNGGRAYVERYEMSPREAIRLVLSAGGIPVLAHPGFFKKGERLVEEDIVELKQYGLLGVEVWHTKHTAGDTAFYRSLAVRAGLLLTGGSDCHGGRGEEALLGKIKLPYEHVERLLATWKDRQ